MVYEWYGQWPCRWAIMCSWLLCGVYSAEMSHEVLLLLWWIQHQLVKRTSSMGKWLVHSIFTNRCATFQSTKTIFICLLMLLSVADFFTYWNKSQIHTHTRLAALFSGITWVSQYQKGKTSLDFTKVDIEWQWHQLGHMQVCTSLQTDNHASTSPLSFLQARCPYCHPTNSIKALKAYKKAR